MYETLVEAKVPSPHLSSPRPAVLAFASADRLKLQTHEYRPAF